MKTTLVACVVAGLWLCADFARSETKLARGAEKKSATMRAVTGPAEPMNRAVAAGATATITLQPVAPKTEPASNYPPGSTIEGTTLTLGEVPARVWLEVHVTGWATETLRMAQVSIDAIDLDGDGGGYAGDEADCAGAPANGAGDITPAMQACNAGTCSNNPAIACLTNFECRRCIGGTNDGLVCTGATGCPGGTCPSLSGITCNGAHDLCRASMSGYPAGGTACNLAEPSRCLNWDGTLPADYFPPGLWCEPGFQDRCDPEFILNAEGIGGVNAVDITFINYRFGMATDVHVFTPDFAPSYLGTLVLDVPANAKGSYRIDINHDQVFTFLCETSSNCILDDYIPIAAFHSAIIEVACGSCCTDLTGTPLCVDGLSAAECEAQPTIDTRHFRDGVSCAEADCCNCTTSDECDDENVCTIDACNSECYCTHSPIAGFDPGTECCHPGSGIQAPIPASSPCRIGGCSLGGSSGSPTFTNVADGTACISPDPCYGDGQCLSGVCQSEEYPGADCPKVRFITFDGRFTPGTRALRIKFLSLHHPDPPYSGAPTADFSAHEGEVRWVGPPAAYIESTADPREVFASFTQCQPHYGDWFFYDLLHITGAVIVPSSEYQVQSIPLGLDINNEANYSAPVTIRTSRWGDLVIPLSPPSTSVQPDIGDIAEIVDKFKNTSQPCTKPRALMVGGMSGSVPNLSGDITFSDISAVVDANRGLGYPYPWPMPCP